MNADTYSFLRRKNRWGLTALSVVLCVAFTPAMSLLAMLPRMMTVLPLLLLLLLGYVGPVSCVICTAVIVFYSFQLFGLAGLFGALLFLVPGLVASPIAIRKKLGFWQSAALCTGIVLTSEYGIMLLISVLAGTDAISAVSALFADSFSNAALSDMLVSMLLQTGAVTGIPAGTVLTAAQKTQVLQSLLQAIDQLLRLEVPMQMATGAISAGVLGQALLRRAMLKDGVQVTYPPLRTWQIPKGWGRVLTVTLCALYLLSLISSGTNAMFYVFSGVFEQAFALQGIAAISYTGHKRGKSRAWQGMIFALGYFILTIPAIILGAADQGFDFTHRRQEFEEKEKRESYDPKADGHY